MCPFRVKYLGQSGYVYLGRMVYLWAGLLQKLRRIFVTFLKRRSWEKKQTFVIIARLK